MTTFFKVIALVLSLGIDTLVVSTSLGMAKAKGKWRLAFVFAGAEGLLALIGLLIGKAVGQFIGHWASLIGGLVLVAVSIWLVFFEDDDESHEQLNGNLVGWTLIMTALSISMDEFTVGFSIGVVGVPVVLTIFLIVLQAFIVTLMGLTFGAKLKPYLGEWSEKLAGIVLGLLGLWICIEDLLALVD